jgi:hypothetical protein
MRITGAGNVGIGTTAPGSVLDVVGGIAESSGGLNVRHTNLTQGISIGYNSIAASGSNANQHVNILPKGTGNVGIGTTGPASALDVQAGTWSAGQLKIGVSGQAGRMRFRRGGDGSDTGHIGWNGASESNDFNFSNSSGGGYFTWSTNPSGSLVERVRLANDGNVGIGTTSPVATLHIEGGDWAGTQDSAAIAIGYEGTGRYPHFIHTQHNSDASWNSINFYTSDGTDAGTFPTNAVHGLTIRNGKVGIGSTSPQASLQVNGGQIAGTYVAANSNTINWSQGNIQSTNVAAGTITFTSGSMLNGTTYVLIISNASSGSYTLSSADISTWKCLPTCASNQVQVTAGKDTIVTILKANTVGYASWIQGF